jgi:Flp pilus assembly protein TadG
MMFTLLVPFLLIPMVGLGIDATMLYSVKVKLQTAVDGGVLAAAESLSAGETVAAQESAASLAADEFIRANIVTGATAGSHGYWGSYNLNDSNCTGSTNTTAGTPTGTGAQITYANSGNCIVIYQDNTNKQRTVSLAASVNVPLLFMRILGFSNGTVTSRGTAARRDVVMVLVIDRSGSMGAELTAVQAGATYFVNQFSAGRDKLGLVLISGSAFVAYPPADLGKTPTTPPTTAIGPDVNFNGTSETPNMITTINNIVSGSNTGTAEGLMLAYHELQAANEPGALNIIVLWTDGAPNGITAVFNNSNGVYTNAVATSSCTYKTDGTNGLYPTAPATNSILGWIAQWGGYAYNTNQPTPGIYQRAQTNAAGTDVTHWAKLSSPGVENALSTSSGPATGCTFPVDETFSTNPSGYNIGNGTPPGYTIPAFDYYGNSTQGINAAIPGTTATYTTQDYKQSNLWTTTGSNCNQGNGSTVGGVPLLALSGNVANTVANTTVKPYTSSVPIVAAGDPCQVGLASWNAADMAARQIHGDTTLTPVIYTMGYAGSVSGNGGVDTVLLERMANCAPGVACSPGGASAVNTVYNPTIPSGMYIQIQTVNDVAPAFQVLLSEILRLSM